MSTLRTNTLQTLDSSVTVDIEDLLTTPDLVPYVKSADLGNTSDVTKGADLVGYKGRSVFDRLQDVVSVKDFPGVLGDGVNDDSAGLQAAIDSGKPLFVPAGTYLMTLSQAIALEGGASVCALVAKTGMQLYGAGVGHTIFKIKDNQSTDASPKYFNLMAANTILSNVHIEGITFDLNGQNNKISPNRAGLVYNAFNCAALMVSGSVATVGVDARMVNSKILHCEVINSPGVTCIALGQSNTNSLGGGSGSVLGSNVEIGHCRFYNNGIDADDHSSLYLWCNNVKVHHCTFDHPVMSSGVQGPLAACELHGAENWFTDNKVNNYLWGVYVAGNYTSNARGQFVQNNDFFVAQKAVILFNETALEPGMSDIVLSGNNVWLTGDHLHGSGAAKRCFDITPSQGNVDGVLVANNTLFTTDLYGAIAVNIGVLAAAKSIRNVLVHGNTTKGFGTPIQFGVTAGGIIDNLKISDNLLADIKPNTTAPTLTIGIYGKASNGTVDISNNKCIGTTTAHPFYGIFLDTGTMSNLHMSDNNFDSGTNTQIQDSVIVVGRRSGNQATLFAALPTQSTWRIGDVITNTGPVELGAVTVPPSKYVLTGWTRVTNGTGNTGTDWLQRRQLTGN